jgi:hypothetical protein
MSMIELRGKLEQNAQRQWIWRGVWSFGTDSKASLPFEYTWQTAVDPSTVPLFAPDDFEVNESLEEIKQSSSDVVVESMETSGLSSHDTQQGIRSDGATIETEEKDKDELTVNEQAALKERELIHEDSSDDTRAEALNEADANISKPLVDSSTSKPQSNECPSFAAKETADKDIDDQEVLKLDSTESNKGNLSVPAGTSTQTDSKSVPGEQDGELSTRPTFADPLEPDDPPFTDAVSKYEGKCPPSGAWKGFFETLSASRKPGAPNVPNHESCFLFLNATPGPSARTQFLDEGQDQNDPIGMLPPGHIHVRGKGENQYGIFELLGSLDTHSGMLQIQRMYVSVRTRTRRRSKSEQSNSDGRPYHTRKRQPFSWKRRFDDETAKTMRRKRQRSDSGASNKLHVTIPDVLIQSAAEAPAPTHSVESVDLADPSPVPISVMRPDATCPDQKVAIPRKRSTKINTTRVNSVAAAASTSYAGPFSGIKLPSCGEPQKAQWRAAHFLYYHRDASNATTSNNNNSNAQPKYVVYEGEMYNKLREGRGVCLYNNGMIYEGTWKLDKEHGVGTLMSSDRKRIIYQGEWERGRMHGRGIYHYDNGCHQVGPNDGKEELVARYDGEFKENTKHGLGTYYNVDGSEYSGRYIEGQQCGRGVFTWPDGSVYEGDWKDGKRHGTGFLKASDGFTYDGAWVNNTMEGRGTAVYPNGQKYVGLFTAGRRDGRGTMLFTNGAIYEGRFRDDAIDGQGTLRLSRPMIVPREDDAGDANQKEDFMIPVSFQSDMGHIHRKAGFTFLDHAHGH